MKNQQKTRRLERLWLMIMLGVMIMFMEIGGVSALSGPFDDSKVIVKSPTQASDFMKEDFNANYGIIEIHSNFMWVDTGKYAEYSLTKNTELCMMNCEAKGKATLYKDMSLFDNIKFKTLTGTDTSIQDSEYLIFDGYKDNWVSVPVYKEVCIDNINLTKSCSQIISDYKSVNQPVEIWNEYRGEVLKAGDYSWKIKGTKEISQSVDFIPIVNSNELNEWAMWTSSYYTGLKSYFNFDNKNFTSMLSDKYGTNSLKNNTLNNINNISTGKNGGAVYLNGSSISGDKLNFTNSLWNNNVNNDTTISLWFKQDNFSAGSTYGWSYIIGSGGITTTNQDFDLHNFNNSGLITVELGSSGNSYLATTALSYNKSIWHNLVITISDNDLNISVDGNLSLSSDGAGWTGRNLTADWFLFDGGNNDNNARPSRNLTIDELAIWNRTLSSSEISDLYNNRAGIFYSTSNLYVDNPIPSNGTTVISSIITFMCNITSNSTYNNITSVKLNATGISNWNQTISGLNTPNYNATFTNSTLSYGNYSWNCIVYGKNGNNVSSNTWNFAKSKYILNSISYNPTAQIGTQQTFAINITSIISAASANFIFNGTVYNSALSSYGTNMLLTNTIIPLVYGTNNFYWSINLDNIFYNTSTYSINISSFGSFGNCSAPQSAVAFNFTTYDEDTKAMINTGVIESSIDLYAFGTKTLLATSSSNSTNGTIIFCVNSSSSNNNYTIYYETKYYNQTQSGYSTEYKYGQNITLTNASLPQVISLYPLLFSESTEFKVNFKDNYLAPIERALIDIQREYIPTNEYISVETPQTDSDGNAIAHLISTNQVYTILMSKDGHILATFDRVVAKCGTTCSIDLNSISSTIPDTDWNSFGNLNTDFSVNKSTRTAQMIFSVMDGTVQPISWNVILNDQWANNTICSDSATTQSGIFTCDVPNTYGNSTIIISALVNNLTVQKYYASFDNTPSQIFGGTRVLIALLMFSTLTLMMISSPVAIIIGAILGLVFAGMLFIINNGGLIGLNAIIMFFILAGGIIIWQINKRIQQ